MFNFRLRSVVRSNSDELMSLPNGDLYLFHPVTKRSLYLCDFVTSLAGCFNLMWREKKTLKELMADFKLNCGSFNVVPSA